MTPLDEFIAMCNDAVVAVEAAAGLFPPATPQCPSCGGTEFWLVEYGYVRTSDLSWQEDHWHGTTDGWDDMSEAGVTEHLCCKACDAMFESPGIDDWD